MTSISGFLRSSADLKLLMASDESILAAIQGAAAELKRTVEQDGCIYACGNGGSACDASHLCEELIARFKRERRGFRAMHFMDPAVLTCWANDYNFAGVFERCADTFCTSRDVLMAFSTSGNSANVLAAVKKAREKGCRTIALTGKGGGELRSAADIAIVIPSDQTERVQEAHITIVHIFCELLENS